VGTAGRRRSTRRGPGGSTQRAAAAFWARSDRISSICAGSGAGGRSPTSTGWSRRSSHSAKMKPVPVRQVTADDFASCVLQTGSGAVATITLSTVRAPRARPSRQVTGSDGTLLLSGETKLELGKSGGPLEDISDARRSLGEDEAQQHVGSLVRPVAARDGAGDLGRDAARRTGHRSATAGRCSACSTRSAAGAVSG